MGNFSKPRNEQPVRVPPVSKEGKPSIGEQKAAALGQTAEKQSALARNRKIILISVCSVAVVLLISAIVCIWYFFGWPANDGLIFNNVMVGGINLGGMTVDEAKATLHEATDHTFTEMDMVIELPDITMNLSPADTGAKLDVDAVVDEAFAYGRLGSYKEREAIKEASLVSTHHIPLLNYLNLDLAYIKGELEDYGNRYNSDFTPSKVEFDIEKPVLDAAAENFKEDAPCQVMTLTIGTPGRYLNMETVYNQVLDAYSFNQFPKVWAMTLIWKRHCFRWRKPSMAIPFRFLSAICCRRFPAVTCLHCCSVTCWVHMKPSTPAMKTATPIFVWPAPRSTA